MNGLFGCAACGGLHLAGECRLPRVVETWGPSLQVFSDPTGFRYSEYHHHGTGFDGIDIFYWSERVLRVRKPLTVDQIRDICASYVQDRDKTYAEGQENIRCRFRELIGAQKE